MAVVVQPFFGHVYLHFFYFIFFILLIGLRVFTLRGYSVTSCFRRGRDYSRQKLKAFNVLKSPEKDRQLKREPHQTPHIGWTLRKNVELWVVPLTRPDVWLCRPRCCSPPGHSVRQTHTHALLSAYPSITPYLGHVPRRDHLGFM